MDEKLFEEIKQFKRDLQSYKSYKEKIKRLYDKVLEMDTRLENVKSPRFNAVPVHQGSTKNDLFLHLIEEKEKINNTIKAYETIVSEVDRKLGKLTKEEQDILKLVYMEHVPIRKIARVYYRSEPTMYRDITDIILKIIEC